MPRNRSEKIITTRWGDRALVRRWARAVKKGEALGLTGRWFGESGRNINTEQCEADTLICDLHAQIWHEDQQQLERLLPEVKSSNDRNIALANLILGIKPDATQS